jgi:hypothetical protein
MAVKRTLSIRLMLILSCLFFVTSATACESRMTDISVTNGYSFPISVTYFTSSNYPPVFELPVGAVADRENADLKNLSPDASGSVVVGRKRLSQGTRVLMVTDANDGRIVDYIVLSFDELEASDWRVVAAPD